MSDFSVLPRDATPRERAISEATAAWYHVPNAILSTIWDPRICPAALVPYIGFAVGLPFWSTKWDVPKQRSVVAAWISISRILGTREAFARCLELVDAELVDWIVPPAICAPTSSRTSAERAAYQAQFPEVRVYSFATRAVRAGILTCGNPWGGRNKAPQASSAYRRKAHRAEYIAGGVTRDVTINTADPSAAFAGGYFEIALPDTTRRLAPGRPWGGGERFTLASTAAEQIFRYQPGSGQPDVLPPSLVPFSLQPTLVAQPHKPGRLLAAGRPWFGTRRCPAPSIADQFVYQSIRLYNADVAVAVQSTRPRGWICGRSQLGTERFRVDVIADTSYRSSGRRFIPGKPLGGVAHEHDPGRIQDVCTALRAAKVGRDKVMLKTGLYREVETADALPPDGSYVAGQIIRTN